ncbi:hypothetical protein REPUB_Repub09cG0010800 [Reevesia pubescens]
MLNENNTIPGWTFQGTVQYVTAGQTISLPANGHAIQLGQDGKINQTFKVDADYMKYILTLTLAPADNLLLNGGFEYGPEFLSNSTEGILLDSALSPVQSPLGQWDVVGTIKYINSKHFFVPHGNAAVEIVSGVSAGIHTEVTRTEGSAYNLEFTLGDANNACERDFIVEVQAGSIVQNFTVRSNGTGLAQKSSMKFEAGAIDALYKCFLHSLCTQLPGKISYMKPNGNQILQGNVET